MDEQEKQYRLAFYKALKDNQIDTVKTYLAERPELVNAELILGPTLHIAVKYGYRDMVEMLLAHGANPNQRGGILGGNALNMAASRGQAEMMTLLLSHGANMETDEPQFNPLFSAIIEGATGAAKVVIDAGIDTSVRYTGEIMNQTDALSFAREWGRSEIVDLLESRNDQNP